MQELDRDCKLAMCGPYLEAGLNKIKLDTSKLQLNYKTIIIQNRLKSY